MKPIHLNKKNIFIFLFKVIFLIIINYMYLTKKIRFFSNPDEKKCFYGKESVKDIN